MRCFQVEYTSCRVGGNAGFQVRAATPGVEEVIGEADMDEVIRLGLYRPLEPCDAPVAFRAVRLSSGRQLVQFSRTLGLDDTGREGNFLTHSLVAESPDARLPLWALDYYEWAGWDRHRTPFRSSENSASLPVSAPAPQIVPLPLPLLELESLAPAVSFAYPELSLFLHETPQRPVWLRAMLANLFLPPTCRRTLIRDEKENNPYWLACLTKLLPRAVANSLCVSTCQPDPQGFDAAAILPDTPVPVATAVFTPSDASIPPPKPRTPVESGIIYARRVVDMLEQRPEAVPCFLHELEGILRNTGD